MHEVNWQGPGILLDFGDYNSPVDPWFKARCAYHKHTTAEYIIDREKAQNHPQNGTESTTRAIKALDPRKKRSGSEKKRKLSPTQQGSSSMAMTNINDIYPILNVWPGTVRSSNRFGILNDLWCSDQRRNHREEAGAGSAQSDTHQGDRTRNGASSVGNVQKAEKEVSYLAAFEVETENKEA